MCVLGRGVGVREVGGWMWRRGVCGCSCELCPCVCDCVCVHTCVRVCVCLLSLCTPYACAPFHLGDHMFQINMYMCTYLYDCFYINVCVCR